MTTSKDVARAAGVSQTTVSRVLHESPLVSPATRARVLAALRVTGYTPHAGARAMKTGRTHTVGVVVAALTNPFYPEMLRALGRELHLAGQRLVVWDTEGPGERAALDAIRGRSVDGLIFTTVSKDSSPLREAMRIGAPVVLINRGFAGLAVDQVTSDNSLAAAAVARYLVAGGRQQIGLLSGPADTTTAVEREEGFLGELERLGYQFMSERFRRADFSHDTSYRAMSELLSAGCDAVFCVNDLTAYGALDAARSRGTRVPDDLWVVGFDDVPMSAWEAFDLTSCRQPIAEMVAAGVRLLTRRVANPDVPPELLRFEAPMMIRKSTNYFRLVSNST